MSRALTSQQNLILAFHDSLYACKICAIQLQPAALYLLVPVVLFLLLSSSCLLLECITLWVQQGIVTCLELSVNLAHLQGKRHIIGLVQHTTLKAYIFASRQE